MCRPTVNAESLLRSVPPSTIDREQDFTAIFDMVEMAIGRVVDYNFVDGEVLALLIESDLCQNGS